MTERAEATAAASMMALCSWPYGISGVQRGFKKARTFEDDIKLFGSFRLLLKLRGDHLSGVADIGDDRRTHCCRIPLFKTF
jgi:hypothetical protein